MESVAAEYPYSVPLCYTQRGMPQLKKPVTLSRIASFTDSVVIKPLLLTHCQLIGLSFTVDQSGI